MVSALDSRDSFPVASEMQVGLESELTFLTGLGDTLSVIGVDDEDDTLGVLEVYPELAQSPPRSILCLMVVRLTVSP